MKKKAIIKTKENVIYRLPIKSKQDAIKYIREWREVKYYLNQEQNLSDFFRQEGLDNSFSNYYFYRDLLEQ